MALIKCPECGKEISDKAEQCPKCACPIDSQQGKVETIELTGKKWKMQLILSAVLIILAVISGVVSYITGHYSIALVSITFIAIGLIWLLAVKFYIWWYHRS
jgi:uncharacterized membrane protein YvbJ